jgi:hypothetical protein
MPITYEQASEIALKGKYYRVETNMFGIPQKNVFCDYCNKNNITASWKTTNEYDLCNDCYIMIQNSPKGFNKMPIQNNQNVTQNMVNMVNQNSINTPPSYGNMLKIANRSKLFNHHEINSANINDPNMNEYIRENITMPIQVNNTQLQFNNKSFHSPSFDNNILNKMGCLSVTSQSSNTNDPRLKDRNEIQNAKPNYLMGSSIGEYEKMFANSMEDNSDSQLDSMFNMPLDRQ